MATARLSAATILAGAQISGVSLGHGNYAYTLTLSNAAASTADIGMFWFAWEAGQADFLTSEPTKIQTPANWQASIEGGGEGDGFSIQFVTFTTPLTPGSSITFTFDSADSPKIMSGPASLYPEYPTMTSQVYSGHAASGVQDVFVAQLVSPPSTNLPALNWSLNSTNLVLTWTAGTNVVLQQTSKLNPGAWTAVPGTLGTGSFSTTNAPSGAPVFFRLSTQ